ncbi:EcoRII N-terminal effector-binding domain-containing protein [Pseudarthrobacter oxydans]|uniref:EcoRII N-terminal effector-binding domain-containing protein n=1 Tax=Pseudarthrobacter oxydans TaxID=1671 RepID=UPI00344DE251
MTATVTTSVSKLLTPNDVGSTGSHQAGIAVPRQDEMLAFFPALDASEYNPRRSLLFREVSGIEEWPLNFIYYNGRLHGRSTRNEYRLTGLTPFFKKHKAAVGDILQLGKTQTGRWTIELVHSQERTAAVEVLPPYSFEINGEASVNYETIRLSGTWSAVSRRKNSVR